MSNLNIRKTPLKFETAGDVRITGDINEGTRKTMPLTKGDNLNMEHFRLVCLGEMSSSIVTNPTYSASNATPYVVMSNSTSLGISQNQSEFSEINIEKVIDKRRQTLLDSTTRETTCLSDTKTELLGTEIADERCLTEKDLPNNASSGEYQSLSSSEKKHLNRTKANYRQVNAQRLVLSNTGLKHYPQPSFQHSRRKQKYPLKVGRENVNPDIDQPQYREAKSDQNTYSVVYVPSTALETSKRKVFTTPATNLRDLHESRPNIKNLQGMTAVYSRNASTSAQSLSKTSVGILHPSAFNMRNVQKMKPVPSQAISKSAQNLGNSQPPESKVVSNPKGLVALNSQISSMYNTYRSMPYRFKYDQRPSRKVETTGMTSNLDSGKLSVIFPQQTKIGFKVPASIAHPTDVRVRALNSGVTSPAIFKQRNANSLKIVNEFQGIDSSRYIVPHGPLLRHPVKFDQRQTKTPVILTISPTAAKLNAYESKESSASEEPVQDSCSQKQPLKDPGEKKIEETQLLLGALSELLSNVDRTLSNTFECPGLELSLPIWKSELQVCMASVETMRNILWTTKKI